MSHKDVWYRTRTSLNAKFVPIECARRVYRGNTWVAVLIKATTSDGRENNWYAYSATSAFDSPGWDYVEKVEAGSDCFPGPICEYYPWDHEIVTPKQLQSLINPQGTQGVSR